MKVIPKTIYEKPDVTTIVLEHHKKTAGAPPDGYEWEARTSQNGVIVEAVESDTKTE